MKLIRHGDIGRERPGLLLPDGARVDASSLGEDYTESFFETAGLDRLSRWASAYAAGAPEVPASVRWAAPLCRPSKIVCIGLNYREHARETGSAIPSEPVVFLKATSAMVGPNDDLILPRGSQKTDWEVELAVVIGRRASYVEPEQALDYVAGYVLHNDYSEREFQFERGGQWDKGKSADTYGPIGPVLTTRDEVSDPQNLSLWLEVNGECRQQGSTNDMIFGVAELVSYVSQFMSLLPGDILSTGTPAGVGMGSKPQRFLRAGDVCRLGISGLGESQQRVRER